MIHCTVPHLIPSQTTEGSCLCSQFCPTCLRSLPTCWCSRRTEFRRLKTSPGRVRGPGRRPKARHTPPRKGRVSILMTWLLWFLRVQSGKNVVQINNDGWRSLSVKLRGAIGGRLLSSRLGDSTFKLRTTTVAPIGGAAPPLPPLAVAGCCTKTEGWSSNLNRCVPTSSSANAEPIRDSNPTTSTPR